jgi:hypothetical protein
MNVDASSSVPSAFRGDFGALAAMMRQSWEGNLSQTLLYSEEFLRSAFDYPGSSFDLAPAIYGDTGLFGFLAGFPRSVLWETHPARLILNTFLTADRTVKGPGVGIKLWADLIERSRREGYDGTINFCVEGDGMDRMMSPLSRLLKINTQRVFSVEFLARPLRPASSAHVSGQDLNSDLVPDIELFMQLASALPGDVPLRRLWTKAEAEWQCRGREGALSVSLVAEGRRGMLTGYLIQAASAPPTTVVLLEDLLWGDLRPCECTELIQRFLHIAAARGAQFASCPVLGYVSLDPVKAAGFRRSKRIANAYLTFWNGLQPRPVTALYMDVL